jgi:hypothetical protein
VCTNLVETGIKNHLPPFRDMDLVPLNTPHYPPGTFGLYVAMLLCALILESALNSLLPTSRAWRLFTKVTMWVLVWTGCGLLYLAMLEGLSVVDPYTSDAGTRLFALCIGGTALALCTYIHHRTKRPLVTVTFTD